MRRSLQETKHNMFITVAHLIQIIVVFWFLWVMEKRSEIFRHLHKIAKSDYKLHHVCLSVLPSVRPSVR